MFSVIPESALPKLKAYKCHSSDASLLRHYVLNHFYEFLMNFVPLSIAPNTITFTGFVLMIFAATLASQNIATLTETNAPGWYFLTFAACLFGYQTLDNLDGKQARKTGTSSPLGELFDHGCDAIVTTLAGFAWIGTASQGMTLTSFGIWCIAYANFIFATWEEYYVGGMNLGIINGPNEGILIIISGLAFAGIAGHGVYQKTIAQLTGFSTIPFVSDMPLWVVVNLSATVITIITVIRNIHTVYKITTSQKFAHDKHRNSFADALMNLFPYLVLFASGAAWIHFSPSGIPQNHVFLFMNTFGIAFGYISSNITLGFIVDTPLMKFSTLTLAPVLIGGLHAVIAAFFNDGKSMVDEYYLLLAWLLSAGVQYLAFVFAVISQITSYLNIRVFTIKAVSQ